jgi:hypothetical protein
MAGQQIVHKIMRVDRRPGPSHITNFDSSQTVHTAHVVLQKSFPPKSEHPKPKGIEMRTSHSVKFESPQPERNNCKSMTS